MLVAASEHYLHEVSNMVFLVKLQVLSRLGLLWLVSLDLCADLCHEGIQWVCLLQTKGRGESACLLVEVNEVRTSSTLSLDKALTSAWLS